MCTGEIYGSPIRSDCNIHLEWRPFSRVQFGGLVLESRELPTLEVTAKAKKKERSGESGADLSTSASAGRGAARAVETDEAGDADGGLSSGGVDGYRATRTATGTKTDTPLIDIPQAITVITEEATRDQHAVDVRQALQ